MERIKTPFRLFLFSAFAWGGVAHGVMLINKFSFHDDARYMFNVGETISSGRWMLALLARAARFVSGGTVYSLPLFNGLLSLLLIACASAMLAHIFRIERTHNCVALTGIMTAFPVVTALFGYMYTAPYYLVGLNMTIIGAWLICGTYPGARWPRLLAGSVLVACGMGVYQAYVCMALTVMLIHTMLNICRDPTERRFRFWREVFFMAPACALIFVLYMVVTRLTLSLSSAELTSYRGISSFGFAGWRAYVERVGRTYAEFFWPVVGKMRDMYPTKALRWLYQVILYLGVLLALDHAWHLFCVKKKRGLEFLFLTVLFPLSVNFVRVMVDSRLVHSLMVYSEALTFVLFLCFMEIAADEHRRYPRWLSRGGVAMLFVVAALYCQFDNVCYFKANVFCNEARDYFTRLALRIESVPGYKPEMPVVFLNELKKQDINAPQYPEFDRVRLLPYLFDQNLLLINNYAWKDFMRLWCGFSPVVIENTKPYEQLPNVIAMPRYPADGSVLVENGAVVVRF